MPCAGVDHVDFSADGSYLIASCEFSGQLVKVNVAKEKLVECGRSRMARAACRQDVKLSPDGRLFFVADMRANGIWEVNGTTLHVTGFLRTGAAPTASTRAAIAAFSTSATARRDRLGRQLPDPADRRDLADPRRRSPDMGGVSADGSVLWLSGRYNREVYAISTRSGRLLARIPVGSGPHGLCVWPQPGRYSLGHTGILR